MKANLLAISLVKLLDQKWIGGSPLRRYGLALLLSGLGLVLRQSLDSLLFHDQVRFIFSLPAITLAAGIAGFGPGLLATAVSGTAWAWLLERSGGMLSADWLALSLFVGVGVGIAYFGGQRLKLLVQLARSESVAQNYSAKVLRLQSLSEALARATDMEEVARCLVEQGARSISASQGVLNQVSEDGQALEPIYYLGYPAQMMRRYQRIPLGFKSPISDAAREGHLIMLDSRAEQMRLYPHIVADWEAAGVQALVAVPLRVGERLIGALGYSLGQPRHWTAEDQDFLLAFSRQGALALSRALLLEAERTANERFARAEAASKGFVFEWDIPAGAIECSPRLSDVLGYEPQEMNTLAAWEHLVHPDDRPWLPQSLTEQLTQGTEYSVEYRLQHRQGHYVRVWGRGRIELGGDGQPIRVVGSLVDITERHQAQEQLRESEAFSRSVLEASPDCIKVLDAEGRLLSMNQSGLNLMEIEDFESLKHQPWASLWPADVQPLLEAALKTAQEGGTGRFQGFCPTAKGTPKWWDVIVTPVRDSRDQPVQLISVSRDITQQKLHEEDRLKKAALEERQKLARDLHDSVSQALYGVALGLETTLKALSNPAQAQHSLDYAKRMNETAIAEMKNLIFELRPESLEQEGLVAALRKQVRSLELRHNLSFELNLGHEPGLDLPLKEALYRIAQEALNNIVKHAVASKVWLALQCGDGICLSIRDNGKGFDTQQAFPGHLGLISMQERAMLVGGAFWLESQPGQGTTLEVRLPAFVMAT